MKTYKELTEAKIKSYILKDSEHTLRNPLDPEIIVPGVASYLYSQVKKTAADKLEQVAKDIKKDDYKKADFLFTGMGDTAFKASIESLIGAKEEMNSSAYKKFIKKNK